MAVLVALLAAVVALLVVLVDGTTGSVAPPSLVHVGIDLAAALVALAVALDPGAGLPAVLRGQPLEGVPFLALLVAGVLAALTTLPRTLAALDGVGVPRAPR